MSVAGQGFSLPGVFRDVSRLWQAFHVGFFIPIRHGCVEPGEFVVNPQVDVMQALSMAGGTTAFANLNDIKILRRTPDGQIAIKFRYDDVIQGRNLQQNIMLQSGDVLVVP